MSEPDLNAIRAAAEAATPGPWTRYDHGAPWPIWPADGSGDAPIADEIYVEADATYIATMDPQTTLGLLERVENAMVYRHVAEVQRERAERAEARAENAEQERAQLREQIDREIAYLESIALTELGQGKLNGLRWVRGLAGLSDKGEG